MVISLRNIPEHLERKIVKKSADESISLNKAVIALLESAEPNQKPRGNYEKYFQTMSDEEYAELKPIFDAMRVVDPIDWEDL